MFSAAGNSRLQCTPRPWITAGPDPCGDIGRPSVYTSLLSSSMALAQSALRCRRANRRRGARDLAGSHKSIPGPCFKHRRSCLSASPAQVAIIFTSAESTLDL